MLPRADQPLNLLGRWLRLCLLHHRLWELPSHPSPPPAHPQDTPERQHSPAADGEQRRPPASQAGVLQRRTPAGQWTGRYLLWSLSPGELWGSSRSLPAALPGGQQDDWELQWREAKGPPPRPTQVAEHAGLKETFEAGSDFQREIGHYALTQPAEAVFRSPEKEARNEAVNKGHGWNSTVRLCERLFHFAFTPSLRNPVFIQQRNWQNLLFGARI